jgi:hypothetical protein
MAGNNVFGGLIMGMTAWDVILNGNVIDTVFYSATLDADYVFRSLVDHDGYDCRIAVRRASR